MTPYQKLIELFAPHTIETRESGAAPVTYKRGGQARLSEALGVSQTLLSKWEKRMGGELPANYYAKICEAASLRGIPRRKIDELYEGCKCPSCGKPVVLTWRDL